MEKIKRGEPFWIVCEHRYYIPDWPAPVLEYAVYQGVAKKILVGPRVKELVVQYNGGSLYYAMLSMIDKKGCFTTPAKAARAAKALTEEHERVWGWLGAPDIPMRRPWEDLLGKEEQRETAQEPIQMSLWA